MTGFLLLNQELACGFYVSYLQCIFFSSYAVVSVRVAGERFPVWEGTPEPHHATGRPHDADTAAALNSHSQLVPSTN